MTRAGRRDEGQSSVELALVLPFVAALLLLVVQIGVVAYRQVLLVSAAREAARTAVVEHTDRDGSAIRAARRAGPLDADRLAVQVTERDGLVTVDATFVDPTDVALVGVLLPDLTLTARVSMRSESP